MIIKEQKNSYHSSLFISPNGFRSSFNLLYFFMYSKDCGRFDLKCFILIEYWLFEFATIFLLIWSACGLVSAKRL